MGYYDRKSKETSVDSMAILGLATLCGAVGYLAAHTPDYILAPLLYLGGMVYGLIKLKEN